MPSRFPPVVLGGGWAGVAAAVTLAEAGLAPVLIESRPFLGGRARSFFHAETGDVIDNGQHLMMGAYQETLGLLERLGTRSLVDLQPALRVEFRDVAGRHDILAAPSGLPSPLSTAIAMIGLRGLSLGDRIRLLRLGLEARFRNPRATETATEYLARLGQSPTAQARLWNPIIVATLNTPPRRASAKLFAKVLRLAFLASGDHARLAFPRVGLSQLIEPAQRLIEERGGQVLPGTPVTHVDHSDGLYTIATKTGMRIETGCVISALPLPAFRSMFASLLRDLPITSTEAAHNPIVSLYLWYDRPLDFVPEFCALLGTSVEWVFNRRKITQERNPAYPGLLGCVVSAADHIVDADASSIVSLADREIRRIFPETRDARLLASQVIKEKRATFDATPAFEQLRPPVRAALPGLWLAGDWTATELPGTIEGAVLSGVRAARGVIEEAAGIE